MSSSRSERYFAPCPRGLEPLLAQELAPLGAHQARGVPGGVAFEGDAAICYAANLHSRLASRVLWQIAEFGYRGEDDIYAAVRAVDWMALFAVERTFRVHVTAQKSPLKSLEFITLRIKDAVCDRFRDALGSRPSIEKARPDVRLHAFLEANRGTLYLDTSGEPLFKRGWRKSAVEAPLRENLAAGIVLLSGWNRDEPLLDPMCGGGTLLVEAAAIALGVAPGAGRSFGFERLASFDASLWRRVRAGGGADTAGRPLSLFGSDADPHALAAARKNLAAAGFGERVKLERADVLERAAPAEAGVLVTNPPYGERTGSSDELARFYPRFGDALKKR
ncbi:MAG: THUMP domain-containing class I SAM-dependent RNA methyltransferase, partial [Burkholderiales bacterium]